MIGDVKSKLEVCNRGTVCEMTKWQVRHCLREQQKVPGSLLESTVPLTKQVWRLRFFSKEKKKQSIRSSRISIK